MVNDPSINPGSQEVCDQKDNNCDKKIDEGFDKDNDGYTTCNGDCNDNDLSVYPGAPELNDGKDNNCNGKVDEGIDTDNDNDGYTTEEGDCNDNDPTIYPGAQEVCNDNKDNDCDSYTDCSDSDCAINSYCIGKDHLLISVIDTNGTELKAEVYVNGSYAGETDAVGTLTLSNLEYAEKGCRKTTIDHVLAQGITWRVLGEVRATLEQNDEAELAFQRSISALEKTGFRLELGISYRTYAEFLSNTGQASDARNYLSKARDIFESTGAVKELRKVECIVKQLEAEL